MSGETGPAFISVEKTSRFLIVMLYATICLSALSAVSGLVQAATSPRVTSGPVAEKIGTANESFQRILATPQLLATLAKYALFLSWIYLVAKKLSSTDRIQLRYTPAGSVVCFFIPILSFVRPVQVLKDFWHAGMTDGTRKTPPVILCWWVLFIVSSFFGVLVFQVSVNPFFSFDDIARTGILSAVSDATAIPCDFLGILIVRRITLWQGAPQKKAAA
jgi:hypothetical protein